MIIVEALIAFTSQIDLVGCAGCHLSFLSSDVIDSVLVMELGCGQEDTFDLQSRDGANIVVTTPYAVIISVADVDFHILSLLIKQRSDTLRLVKG